KVKEGSSSYYIMNPGSVAKGDVSFVAQNSASLSMQKTIPDFWRDQWSRVPSHHIDSNGWFGVAEYPLVVRNFILKNSEAQAKDKKSKVRIIDLGCGANLYIPRKIHDFFMSKGIKAEIHGLDPAREEDVRRLSTYQDIIYHTGRMEEPTMIEGNSMDIVVSTFALDYTDMRASLEQINKMLSANGRALLVLHHPESDSIKHVREYLYEIKDAHKYLKQYLEFLTKKTTETYYMTSDLARIARSTSIYQLYLTQIVDKINKYTYGDTNGKQSKAELINEVKEAIDIVNAEISSCDCLLSNLFINDEDAKRFFVGQGYEPEIFVLNETKDYDGDGYFEVPEAYGVILTKKHKGSCADMLNSIIGDDTLLGKALAEDIDIEKELKPVRSSLKNPDQPYSDTTIYYREIDPLIELGILVQASDGKIKFSDMMTKPGNKGPPDKEYTKNLIRQITEIEYPVGIKGEAKNKPFYRGEIPSEIRPALKKLVMQIAHLNKPAATESESEINRGGGRISPYATKSHAELTPAEQVVWFTMECPHDDPEIQPFDGDSFPLETDKGGAINFGSLKYWKSNSHNLNITLYKLPEYEVKFVTVEKTFFRGEWHLLIDAHCSYYGKLVYSFTPQKTLRRVRLLPGEEASPFVSSSKIKIPGKQHARIQALPVADTPVSDTIEPTIDLQPRRVLNIDKRFADFENKDLVGMIINKAALSDEELRFIDLRYTQGMTLEKIGYALNLKGDKGENKREAARHMKNKILEKLRQAGARLGFKTDYVQDIFVCHFNAPALIEDISTEDQQDISEQNALPQAQSPSVRTVSDELRSISEAVSDAERIHRKNLDNPPNIAEKTILCHIITESIVPVEQRNTLKVMVEQEMNKPMAKGMEYRERVVCLSGANADNLKEFIRDLRGEMQKRTDEYRRSGYTSVQFDVACPNTRLVSAILNEVGIKALAFEPYRGGEFSVVQIEGIMLALRALRSCDIKRLKAAFAFLAGGILSAQQSAIEDINEFIQKVTFILPAAKIEDTDDLAKINNLIATNIRNAA
ncbi:MAG: hypothetical protein JW800_08315, partial [Candidatus Omnitrophica bacterium]|nr:hypothetical protein [Candidatus Omnitrophota bacterium]